MKKAYKAPSLTVHGNVEDLTQNSPVVNQVDVPLGTPVDPGDIDSITS